MNCNKLKEIFAGFQKEIFSLFTAGFLTFLSVAFVLVYPYFLKLIIDNLIYSNDIKLVLNFCAVLLFLQLASAGFQLCGNVLFSFALNRYLIRLRNELFSSILQKNSTEMLEYSSADVTTRITTNVDELCDKIEKIFFSALKMLFSLAIMLTTLFVIDAGLLLVVLFLFSLLILLPTFFNNIANRMLSKRPVLQAKLISLFKDRLFSFSLVKMLHLNQSISEDVEKTLKEYYSNEFQMIQYYNLGFTVKGTLYLLVSISILYFGGRQVIQERYSMGDLLLFVMFVDRLFPFMNEFIILFVRWNVARNYWDRCHSLLQKSNPVIMIDQAKDINWELDKGIRLESLSFSYNTKKNILQDTSLIIPSKTLTAVIGKSGTGKSTLLKLLLRELLPSQGRIWFYGQDIQKVPLSVFYRMTGYVPQSSFIFPGTISENLQIGARAFRGSIEKGEEEEVCRMVGLYGYIQSLPMGFETKVGEGYQSLSGGEKQRLSLARTLLKRPSLLLLDEPTSSLDYDNKIRIIHVLHELKKNYTIVVATHQKEFLEYADQSILLEDGGIYE